MDLWRDSIGGGGWLHWARIREYVSGRNGEDRGSLDIAGHRLYDGGRHAGRYTENGLPKHIPPDL